MQEWAPRMAGRSRPDLQRRRLFANMLTILNPSRSLAVHNRSQLHISMRKDGSAYAAVVLNFKCNYFNGKIDMKYHHQHRPLKHGKAKWEEKDPALVPLASQVALRRAILIEQVSIGEYNDLLWIMAQESGGVVNARNSASTARGLFQLLAAQYPLNPNGINSFGDAVEECQGGIHYIMGRYHSAKIAKTFWQKHHWY
jgi:hypothetical protein